MTALSNISVYLFTIPSIALHLAVFALTTPFVPTSQSVDKKARVSVDIVNETQQEVLQDPQVRTQTDVAAPSHPAKRFSAPAVKPPTQTAPSPEPPPAQETPIDMTGVTLTNAQGKFTVASGDGTESDAALGRSGVVSARSRDGVEGGVVGAKGETVAQMGDLARAPVPPALDAVLESNYPPDARAQGLGAVAAVRIHIASTGQVRVLRVVSESVKGYGFGAACRKTLEGRPWSAPIDKNGKPVAIEVTYTCTFEVRY